MSIDTVLETVIRPLRRRALWCAVAAGCCGCSGGPDDGLKKYPVRGAVLVNGKPAPLMVVTFNNVDEKAPGNAARPVARCDDQGQFELSTNGDKDGAVEGQYAVTFFWPSDEGPLPVDRLGGRFGQAAISKFKVSVSPKVNELEPIRLEIDPKQLKPASD